MVNPDSLKKSAQQALNMAGPMIKQTLAAISAAASAAIASATGNKIKLPVLQQPTGGSTPVDVGTSRPMKFPYTFTAKVVQFPWVYYAKNNWVYKYYFIAIIVCLPIFKKISNVFNSPANVKKWEEIKRKEHEKEALEHH